MEKRVKMEEQSFAGPEAGNISCNIQGGSSAEPWERRVQENQPRSNTLLAMKREASPAASREGAVQGPGKEACGRTSLGATPAQMWSANGSGSSATRRPRGLERFAAIFTTFPVSG